ncbi:TPA: serine hydroxymethyltransferase [Streptococcus pneumoniae]
MRKTFIDELINKNIEEQNIVVLTGDVGRSTYASKFKEIFPENYLNLGICEANIVGISAGIAGTLEFVPFVMLFSKHLILRALEQINDSILMNKKKVILVGGYSGYSASKEGETHQLLNDISILSSFPDISIYCPYDQSSIQTAINESINNDYSSYIRINKNKILNDVVSRYISQGNKSIIISMGYLGSLLSKKYMEDSDIREFADFILVSKIKPIDWEYRENFLRKYETVYIIEENTLTGGLGEQFKNYFFGLGINIISFGIKPHFGETGDYETLLTNEGLSPDKIFEKIRRINHVQSSEKSIWR